MFETKAVEELSVKAKVYVMKKKIIRPFSYTFTGHLEITIYRYENRN